MDMSEFLNGKHEVVKGTSGRGMSGTFEKIKNEFQKDFRQTPKDVAVRKLKKDIKKATQKILFDEKQEKIKENKAIRTLIEDWIKLMAHKGLDNELDETFALTSIVKETYGFSCNINIYDGGTFSILESAEMKATIEDNLGCIFITTRLPKSRHLEAKFIMEDIPAIDFKPYYTKDKNKLEPYELYLSTSIDGEPIVANMLHYPHCIIQGSTNMGKTKMIDAISTNLIVQNNPEDLSLYYIQIDKPDQIIYKKCKHVKAYAEDIYQTLALTNWLKAVVEERKKVIAPLLENGICDNIQSFNKVYKKYKQHKFSYMYLIIDEYSSLMPGEDGNKERKAVKVEIQENMEKLIQIGRYVGLYIIVSLQRSTIDKLPSFVKAMCCTIVTFHVNNERSSFVAIDSNEAVGLNQRESIIKTDKKQLAKTVTITPATILHYVKPLRWSNGMYKNFVFDSWIPDEFKKTKDNQEDKDTKQSKHQSKNQSKNQKRKNERYGTSDENDEMTDDELFDLVSKK